MSLRDDLEKSLNKEIEYCDEYLEKTTNLSSLAPDIQTRKDEAQAQLESIRRLPDDLIEEVGPEILRNLEKNHNRFKDSLPFIPKINTRLIRLNMTSTTTSSTTDIMSAVVRGDRAQLGYIIDYFEPLTQLAEDDKRNETIIKSYSNINSALGDYIQKAQETILSARGGVASIDLACQHIRTAISKIWGEVADFARVRCKSVNMRLQLSKKSHQKNVAECLGNDRENTNDIESLLNSLSILYSDLSASSKNPFIKDIDYLNEVSTRWNLHIYNLAQALGFIEN